MSEEFLHFSELQFLVNGANVALNKPTSATDDFEDDFILSQGDPSTIYTKDKAVDGSEDSIYHSLATPSAFWMVDLQVRWPSLALPGPCAMLPCGCAGS